MLSKIFGQGNVKQGLSWSLYDFANSSYAVMIMSFVFPIFYREVVAGKERGDFYWGVITSLSILLGALAAPIIGAMADEDGRKKRKFISAVLIAIIATALLFFSGPSTLILSSLIFIAANLCFEIAQTLYDSFLGQIAPKNLWGRISGFAWGLGYIGGVAAMLILMPFYSKGFEGNLMDNYRLTFPLTAIFFLIFSLPIFLWVKEPASKITKSIRQLLTSGFGRVFHTIKNIRNHKDIAWFLLAFYFMNDAMVTLFSFMPIFARTTLGIPFKELTILLLGVQIIAFPAAWFSGYISDKVGQKPILLTTLIGWFALTTTIFFSQVPWHFYIGALLGGLVIGSSQGAARAWMTKLVPEEKRSEFFGFNGFASKIAATTGPVIFGALASFTGNQRWGVLAMLPFFFLSFIIFYQIKET